MQLHSITADPDIRSFRLCQIIESTYHDMPEAGSTTEIETAARRDPAALLTTTPTDVAPPSTTLIVSSGPWSGSGKGWELADTGPLPDDWALNAYRELGDMSLVAPLSAQAVVDGGRIVGMETIDGVQLTHVTAETELMMRLLMEHFHSSESSHDPVPPEIYINRYDADLWIDRETGYVIQERTVVEYTEERLHGQSVGTGPATFTTTRRFYDFNEDFEIPDPRH